MASPLAAPAHCRRPHHLKPRKLAEAGKEPRLLRDSVSSASFDGEVQSKFARFPPRIERVEFFLEAFSGDLRV